MDDHGELDDHRRLKLLELMRMKADVLSHETPEKRRIVSGHREADQPDKLGNGDYYSSRNDTCLCQMTRRHRLLEYIDHHSSHM